MSDNRFTDREREAAGFTGVEILSENTRVRENTFRNLEVGIAVLEGAVDTKIAENTFHAVAIEVDDQTGGQSIGRCTSCFRERALIR